jgi:dTMP kinase
VTDRFLDSSLAYQGGGRGLGIEAVLALNADVAERCTPDLSLVIDTPVAVAAERRCAGPDRIEAEGDGFQQRVADGYRELARRFPRRVRLVPADGDRQTTHRAVMAEVAALT